MDVDKLTIAVEIDGAPYFVLLPEGTKDILLHMIQGVSTNSKLNVVKAPEGFKFEALANQ